MSWRAASSLVIGVLVLGSAHPYGQGMGDRVRVESASAQGVPLHRESRSSLIGRLVNGSVGAVEEVAEAGRWLRVQGDAGERDRAAACRGDVRGGRA